MAPDLLATVPMKISLLAVLLLATVSAQARLGETSIQCADRYGPAKSDQATASYDKMFPILEGAIQKTFAFGGWQIRTAFLELDGPSVCIVYQKIPGASVNAMIQDYEVSAILAGEAPAGMSWTPIQYQNPNSPNHGLAKMFADDLIVAVGAKAWRRTDGAIAQVLPPGMVLRIESPASQAHQQQLKAQREEKARASVPQF